MILSREIDVSMSLLRILLACLSGIWLLSVEVLAQLPDTLLLDQVEVIAEPYSIASQAQQQKIDAVPLRMTLTSDVGVLLQQYSPLFVKSNTPGGLTTVSFRGSGASHTMVLWNGFPINSSQHGQVDFSLLPVFLADQIELAWAMPVDSYTGGLGGTVTLKNNPKYQDGLKLKLIQSAASFGNYGSFADVSYSGKQVQFRTRVFNRFGKNDFRFLNTAGWPPEYLRQKDAEYYDRGFLQEINAFKANHRLNFQSWNQWNDRSLPAIMTNLERGGAPHETQGENYSRNILSYKYYWHDGSAELNTAIFFNRMNYELITTTQWPPYNIVTHIESENKADSWMNHAKLSQTWNKTNELTVLMGFDNDYVNTNNFADKVSRIHMWLKAGSEHHFSKAVHARLSLQHTWVDRKAIGLLPAVAIDVYPLQTPDFVLSVFVGSNYRLPGMNDLYWNPGGNPNLQPEKASSIDLGLFHRLTTEAIEVESRISTYYSLINDWILWRPSAYRYWIPENIAKVKARGLELTERITLNIGKIQSYLNLSYAFTLTTDESAVDRFELTTGKQLMYIPLHHGNALLRLTAGKLGVYYQFEYTDSRYTNFSADDAHYSRLPAYALHHAGLSTQQIKNFDIQFGINNLMNKSYQAVLWRPMPGRHFQLQIIYSIPIKIKTQSNE